MPDRPIEDVLADARAVLEGGEDAEIGELFEELVEHLEGLLGADHGMSDLQAELDAQETELPALLAVSDFLVLDRSAMGGVAQLMERLDAARLRETKLRAQLDAARAHAVRTTALAGQYQKRAEARIRSLEAKLRGGTG